MRCGIRYHQPIFCRQGWTRIRVSPRRNETEDVMLKWKLAAVIGVAFGLAGTTWGFAQQQRQSPRFFELRTYTASPDRMDKLLARFRNHTTRIFEKHGM